MKQDRGFTLIELLIGLFIFALIAAGLYSSFYVALGLDKRSSGANKVYREARWTMDRIDRDLENLVFYDFSGSYDNKGAFVGEKNNVMFVIHAPDGLKVVQYYLKDNVSGQARVKFLCRREVDFGHFLETSFKDLAKEKDQEEVLTDVIAQEGLRFSYLKRAGGGWQDTWSEKDTPDAIKVELTFIAQMPKEEAVVFKRMIRIPLSNRAFKDQMI